MPMNDRPNPLPAPGYTKHRGAKSERNDMIVEAQHQTRFGEGDRNEARVFIRVSTKPAHLRSGFWLRLPWRNKSLMSAEANDQ